MKHAGPVHCSNLFDWGGGACEGPVRGPSPKLSNFGVHGEGVQEHLFPNDEDF